MGGVVTGDLGKWCMRTYQVGYNWGKWVYRGYDGRGNAAVVIVVEVVVEFIEDLTSGITSGIYRGYGEQFDYSLWVTG